MERNRAIGLIAVALILGFVGGFKVGRVGDSSPAPAANPTAPSPDVGTAALPRLLELGSTECIPCKQMAPIIEELKREYAGKVDIEFIDVYANVQAADEYKINVIPTQVFIGADGREVARHEGFYPKADIVTQFEKMGVRTR